MSKDLVFRGKFWIKHLPLDSLRCRKSRLTLLLSMQVLVFTWNAVKDDKIVSILSLRLSLIIKLLCHLVVSQVLEEELQARGLTILASKPMPQLCPPCKGASKSSLPMYHPCQSTSPAVLPGSSWTPRTGTTDKTNQPSSSVTVKHLKLTLQDTVRSRSCGWDHTIREGGKVYSGKWMLFHAIYP